MTRMKGLADPEPRSSIHLFVESFFLSVIAYENVDQGNSSVCTGERAGGVSREQQLRHGKRTNDNGEIRAWLASHAAAASTGF